MAKESEQSKAVDTKALNLYQKLAAITGEVAAIAKGGTNTEQKYQYIEYGAVAGELRGLFAKYGVIIVPSMQKTSEQSREEITSKYGAKGVAVLIDFEYRVINADKPDDNFTVNWVGEAADYGDKATNKAATSALKYYLMRQFNISEKGEDPDGESPDRGTISQAPVQPAKPKAPEKITPDQIKKLFATIGDKGIEGEDQKKLVYKLAKVESTKDLSKALAAQLIDKIEKADPEALQAFLHDKPTADQLKTLSKEIREKIGNKFLMQKKVDLVIMGVAGVESLDDVKGSDVPELIKNIKEVEDVTLLTSLYDDSGESEAKNE